MTWFRVETGIGDHELVGAMAEALNLTVAAAVGHYVMVLAGFTEYQQDGLAGAITDTTLEEWSKWRGKRREFARFFREHCVEHREGQRDQVGMVRGWWRQEALVREQERKRKRPGQGSRHAENREGREEAARESLAETLPIVRGNVDEDVNANAFRLLTDGAGAPDAIGYTQRCTAAANRGMRDNPLIKSFNELVTSAQDEPLIWHRDGIPVTLAEAAVYRRARAYRPGGSRTQPTTLGYFRNAVNDAWSKAQGRALEHDINTHLPAPAEEVDRYELAARRLQQQEARDAG